MSHVSVLLKEAIEGLDIHPGDIFVDATLGSGGHSEEVAKLFGNAVAMIGIDLDPESISRSRKKLEPLNPNVRYVESNFRQIDVVLAKLGIEKVDKILFDLGWSSDQFLNSGRGFSFQADEPLIMTFGNQKADEKTDDENKITAREILNEWDEQNISTILYSYGEEKFADRIAGAVVRARKLKPIETTLELVEIILSATPKFYHHRKIHPATKTFQALRMTVNDEICALREGIRKGFESLNVGGKMAVISFHSIEDREVKNFFREKFDLNEGALVAKKPITPSRSEIVSNPRSRSAKLRIIQKLNNKK